MLIAGGNLVEFEKAKQLTVAEYLVKMEYMVKQTKKKKTDG